MSETIQNKMSNRMPDRIIENIENISNKMPVNIPDKISDII